MRWATNLLCMYRIEESVIVFTGKTLDYIFGSYFQLKNDVFNRPLNPLQTYSVTPLETFLKEIFGEDKRMTDLGQHPRVMTISLADDVIPHQLCLFRSYIGPYGNQHDATGYFTDIIEPGECE